MKTLLLGLIVSMSTFGVAQASEIYLRCELTSKLTVSSGTKVISESEWGHISADLELDPSKSRSQTIGSGVNERDLLRTLSIQGTRDNILVYFDATYTDGSKRPIVIATKRITSLKDGAFTEVFDETIPDPDTTYGKERGVYSDFVLSCKEIL